LISECPPEGGRYSNRIEVFHSSHFPHRIASSAFSIKFKKRWFKSITSQKEISVDNIPALQDTGAPLQIIIPF